MTLRLCNNCYELKPLTDFYPKMNRGKPGFLNHCKICHREVVYCWKYRNRPDMIDAYLSKKEEARQTSSTES